MAGSNRYSYNCFNHSTYHGLQPTLPGQVAAAGAAGYRWIGLDVPSLLAHEAAGVPPEAIRACAEAAGVACFELVPLSLGGDPRPGAASLDTVARLAEAVGARHVLATLRSPVAPDTVSHLGRAAERLATSGASISVEFMPASPLPTMEQALELLAATGIPEVGLVVDTWHVCLGGCRWETFEQLPVECIGFVQLADASAGASGTSDNDMLHRRLLPGEGDLPLDRVREVLIDKGYDGVFSVEVLSRPWRDRPIEEFARATLTAARAWAGALDITTPTNCAGKAKQP